MGASFRRPRINFRRHRINFRRHRIKTVQSCDLIKIGFLQQILIISSKPINCFDNFNASVDTGTGWNR